MTDLLGSILTAMGLKMSSFALDNVLIAAIVLVVCLILTKLINRLVAGMLSRSKLDRTLHVFIRSAIRVLLYVLTGIIVLGTLGFNVSSLVAVLSVAGLAVSLAMQSSLANLAGGVLLLVTKPFAAGDYIETDGMSGTVQAIGLAYTVVNTLDNKRISIPNSQISSAKIINYSAEGKRQVVLSVTAAYENSIEQVKAALQHAVDNVSGVLNPGDAFIRVTGYGESSISYTVRVWCETENYWPVYYDLLEQVKRSFDLHGVEIPYNHLNVHIIET